jgi:hypothetical protein
MNIQLKINHLLLSLLLIGCGYLDVNAQNNPLKIRQASCRNDCHHGISMPPKHKPETPKICNNHYFIELTALQKATLHFEKMWLKDKILLPLQEISYEKGRKKGYDFRKNELLAVRFNTKKKLKYTPPPRAFKGDALISYTVNGKRQYLEVKQIKQIKPM